MKQTKGANTKQRDRRSGKTKRRSVIPPRYFNCPSCGGKVMIPFIWIIGIESIFPCGECGKKFRTGYKMGALLFGLSLSLAVVTANLGAYIFSARSIIPMAILVIPLWVFYGYLLRRLWLIRVSSKKTALNRKSGRRQS